jgi:bifunctional non-homologous end joining protein LigD
MASARLPRMCGPAPGIELLSPMLLDERKVAPDVQDAYVAEVKYDGYRVLGQFGDGSCVLRTRNGVDCTRWFPEVSMPLAAARHGRMAVDGEMCILDAAGRSDFDALHDRARRRKFSDGDVAVTFCVFDTLVFEGRDVMALSLVRRKQLLEDLLEPGLENVLYARHISSGDVDEPISWLYARALELELEGIVGKRADSTYTPGERSRDWFKLKRPGAVPPERFHRKK